MELPREQGRVSTPPPSASAVATKGTHGLETREDEQLRDLSVRYGGHRIVAGFEGAMLFVARISYSTVSRAN